MYGDGSQSRSFCFVDDMVDGVLLFMEMDDEFKGPLNMGNPNEFTIQELAERVINLTGSNSKIIYKPLPEDDPKQRRPNIDLAKEKLNWSPKVELEAGLERTIAYFKESI